tara:strand:+ start:541 stop:1476 length:936 start_codon:yes stop_codon:yes gene_type:complete
MKISIYNTEGISNKSFTINDDIEFLGGRVSKGKKVYYKGIGVPYLYHYIDELTDEYEYIRESNIFYVGKCISKKCFQGKHGVFEELYQPYFPDYIGSCSGKEGPIVLNSMKFELSSIEIFDCISIDEKNEQYYYIVDYKCKRKRYLNDGDPHKLRVLIDYMLANDWNSMWDKNAINDVTADGRISDVADLFESSELKHKLGTVYSHLYSLNKANPIKYKDFLDINGLQHPDHLGDFWYIYNSVWFLNENGIDTKELFPYTDLMDNYKHTIINYLVTGRNTAYCACNAFVDQGNEVMKQYEKIVKKEFNVIE